MYGTTYNNAYDEYSNKERAKIINRRLHKNDTLIILGDIGNIEYLKLLKPCYKVLILGNHDAGRTVYEDYFDEIYEGPLVISEKIILSHEKLMIPGMLNIHGHCHDADPYNDFGSGICFNISGNLVNFNKLNLKEVFEFGIVKRIPSIHRLAIEKQKKYKNEV